MFEAVSAPSSGLQCASGKGVVCRCADRSEIVCLTGKTVKGDLRKIFSDHAFYEMLYLRSALLGFPDAKLLEGRLMNNARVFGEYNRQFIGDEKARLLENKMKEHFGEQVKLIMAIRSQKVGEITAVATAAYSTNDSMAKLLSGINRADFPFDQTRAALNAHTFIYQNMAIAFQEARYDAHLEAWDKYYKNMLEIADTYANAYTTKPHSVASPPPS